ncbi:hypothetical protein ACHHYP_05486 [Achlya hypogyna]|uniref:Transmembrane protein n=1 Tax=Achlya hypogyna TaxID=1202772 RepID=A0A1V9YY48_ACHHY|nr:hypothetical protein ACHHYP_05486 [Achlya hypogyna]
MGRRSKVATVRGPTQAVLRSALGARPELEHHRPLEAYLSEALPWTTPAPMNLPHAPFAAFNASALASHQAMYNRQTLPMGAKYFADSARNSYVLRRVVTAHNHAMPTPELCMSEFLAGLPGVLFYGPRMNEVLCAFAASSGAETWHNQGTCVLVTFLTLPIATECLWLTAGDDVANTTVLGESFTLTFALTQYPYQWLVWLKFSTRVVSTLLILYLLWHTYFRHYFDLARHVNVHGHQTNIKNKHQVWHYLLIAGDPTVLLVTHPWVVFGFFVDLCLSPHIIAASVLRLLQTDNFEIMLRAALYLFRMVWIAYASVCVAAVGLKRFRKEHLFAEVDPTMMTLATVFYGPLIWIIGGLVPWCLEWFQWLLICVESHPHERIEIIFVGGAYIILVAWLPLSYGFGVGYFHSRRPRVMEVGSFSVYSSFHYNSLKNRALFAAARPIRNGELAGASYGGIMYALFKWNPRYRACPTMNFRGADCFLLCYCNGELTAKIRLSLLAGLDCNLGDPVLAVETAQTPSRFPVNALTVVHPGAELTNMAKPSKVALRRPREPSLWCIVGVALGPQLYSTRFSVRRNRTAFAISMVMLMNIASMPIKAYLSEFLPGQQHPDTAMTFVNYSEFTTQTLAHKTLRYNATTLPLGAKYIDDVTGDTQVLRATINLSAHVPMDRSVCLQSFVLGLPGLIYYTPRQLELLCALAATANVTVADWDGRGGCYVDKFCTVEIGHSCVWLTAGDAVHGAATNSSTLTITYTFTGARFESWLWFKLVYRMFLIFLVSVRMWQGYYGYCWHLERTLATYGHRQPLDISQGNWRYEIVFGDPTAVVLMDPWVAAAFVVDIWISTNSVGIAVLRASQNGDLYVMFITFIYLSRTVWFAYCALCITAHYLKRYSKEHAFAEVDPTLVAIGVGIYGPLVSWLAGNVGFLAQVYQFSFTCLVPEHLKGQENELAPGCAMYTILIASLPLMYGFAVPPLRRRFNRSAPVKQDYSSPIYNSIKSRTLLQMLRPFRHSTQGQYGGSVYRLFAANPKYKNCPTISLRGADCFLLCYHRGMLHEKMRLSLLSSLDRNQSDPGIAIAFSSVSAATIVNSITEKGVTPTVINRSEHTSMTKVAAVRGPTTPKAHSVRCHRVALLVSVVMMLNIASMPAKAYFTEYFPGRQPPVAEPNYSNYSAFAASTLVNYQALYNNETLPSDFSYHVDVVNDTHVLRQRLDLTEHKPMDRRACLASFVLNMPGLIYYTPAQLDLVCDLAATDKVSANDWDRRGSCHVDKNCGAIIGHSCTWLMFEETRVFTLMYAFTGTRFNLWLWAKLVYRVGLTILVCHRMATQYYGPCRSLERTLETTGHRPHLAPGKWHYELVLGDPTAIILMDPTVAVSFLVDIWISSNSVGIAVLLASHYSGITATALNCLYLSRTVWFAYCSLCITAHYLKRFQKEHLFAQVDPTLVAVAVAVYGPVVSWLSGSVAFVAQLYQWTFTFLVPTHLQGVENELAPGCIVYTLLIASLPVLYGLSLQFLRGFRSRAPLRRTGLGSRSKSQAATDYSNPLYNSLKGCLLFSLLRAMQQASQRLLSSPVDHQGGSVYRLFDANPRYQQCPTISMRSADCFVYCYCNDELREKIRLSLMSSLDRNLADPALAIPFASETSTSVFNEIESAPKGAGTRIRRPFSFPCIVSMVMLINIASMVPPGLLLHPMKAYLSEPLPSFTSPQDDTIYPNYTLFNAQSLAIDQALYNRATILNGSKYFIDDVHNAQVLRHVLSLESHQAMSRSMCASSFVLGMPGLIYYSPRQLDMVCELAAASSVNVTKWDGQGSCFHSRFLTVEIGHVCVWLTAGGTESWARTAEGKMTITFAFTGVRFFGWLWIKLIYRLAVTGFVMYRMWASYFKHCVELYDMLAKQGHRPKVNASKATWTYEVVLGDPTAIILMDPWVATAFVVDMWMSTSSVGIAVLRASQNGDLYIMLLTFIYLSRTVWFAYCALCLTAHYLKHFRKEHAFAEVDPTVVAVGVAGYGPLVSWLSGNVGFLAQVYQFSFFCLVPPALQAQQNELAPGCAMYTVLIASLPLMYGFAAPCLGRAPVAWTGSYLSWRVGGCSQRRQDIVVDYSDERFNSVKSRCIFSLLRMQQSSRRLLEGPLMHQGGTIYHLFHANPRYKRCSTISMRSTDCFIRCYKNGELEERLRLNLVTSLDRNLADPLLAVRDAKEASGTYYNELHPRSSAPGTWELRRPAKASCWCL